MQSRLVNKIIPGHWGYKTTLGPWEVIETRVGWIDDIVHPSVNSRPGLHTVVDNQLRYRVESQTKLRPRSSLTGFAGAAVFAASIDGLVQYNKAKGKPKRALYKILASVQARSPLVFWNCKTGSSIHTETISKNLETL